MASSAAVVCGEQPNSVWIEGGAATGSEGRSKVPLLRVEGDNREVNGAGGFMI